MREYRNVYNVGKIKRKINAKFGLDKPLQNDSFYSGMLWQDTDREVKKGSC